MTTFAEAIEHAAVASRGPYVTHNLAIKQWIADHRREIEAAYLRGLSIEQIAKIAVATELPTYADGSKPRADNVANYVRKLWPHELPRRPTFPTTNGAMTPDDRDAIGAAVQAEHETQVSQADYRDTVQPELPAAGRRPQPVGPRSQLSAHGEHRVSR